MSDRWKMNRIGFVNFWLYDEEDFEFVDGKLLLRGQNGWKIHYHSEFYSVCT